MKPDFAAYSRSSKRQAASRARAVRAVGGDDDAFPRQLNSFGSRPFISLRQLDLAADLVNVVTFGIFVPRDAREGSCIMELTAACRVNLGSKLKRAP